MQASFGRIDVFFSGLQKRLQQGRSFCRILKVYLNSKYANS